MNFTPLRDVLQSYSNKFVLLGGSGKINEIAEDCGLKHYITIDEFV